MTQVIDRIGAIFSAQTLKGKVFRGGAWLGTGSIVEQAIRLGRSMTLARLLAPEAFGLMAIVGSSSMVIHTITDIGVKEALIQHPRGTEDEYKCAAWWLASGRSLMLYAIFFILAPLVAGFYGNKELSPLLRVVTLGVIFDGIYSSNAYIALKEMKFGKWAAMNHGGSICGVILTVILGFFLRDVWALVIGGLSESVFRCGFSYILCPYLPLFTWNREAVRDLLRFSKGIFGLSFLNLIFTRADVFVLGKLYSPTALGLYAMAVYLVQTPGNYVINLLNQTLLPTFSHVQQDNDRLNRMLLKVLAITALLGLPAFVFAFFCGRSLLTVVFGSQYSAASTSLILAAAVSVINIWNVQITLVFYSKASPQLHRTCVIIMAVSMIVLTYPLAKVYGLMGGQMACLISITAGYFFQLGRIHKLTGLNLAQYGKTLLLPAAISLTAIVTCLSARSFSVLNHPSVNILFGVLACALAYGISMIYLLRNREKVFA